MNHELAKRRRLYNDLSDEIREHLEEKIEELVANGIPRKEATAAARRNCQSDSGQQTVAWRKPPWKALQFHQLFRPLYLGSGRRSRWSVLLSQPGSATLLLSATLPEFHVFPFASGSVLPACGVRR